MKKIILFFIVLILCSSCNHLTGKRDKVIIAVPVYGQSLALGEEAQLVTNFDTLKEKYHHRILTEDLDENFGYFSNTIFKQQIKKWLHDHRRTFEVSCYGLGESVISSWMQSPTNNRLVLCTFPGGEGTTSIDYLGKGTLPYRKLLAEIKKAYNLAHENRCIFIVPAFCWLQGENDVVWNTGKNYKEKLIKFRDDLDQDIKGITHQKEDVKCILYQTTCLSISKDTFNMLKYYCPQTRIPQAQMELVRDDRNFVASGPTYPYSIARNYVHLDGLSQKRFGYLEGLSLLNLLNNKRVTGLTPRNIKMSGHVIIISFNIPQPPLVLDTVGVSLSDNYGFSVINNKNKNILAKVVLSNDKIYLICSEMPRKARARYAVNGVYWNSGCEKGPRGNLRDSQGDLHKSEIRNNLYRIDNWCYMFDILVNNKY